MKTYTMLFRRDPRTEPERVQFDADDPNRAFSIAKRESGDQPVELWEGGKRLARLTPLGGELWQID